MIREEEMYGLETAKKFGYDISPGKKYQVRILHRRLAPDAWLEEEFHIVDDSGARVSIPGMMVDCCLMRKKEWRARQIESIGI
jgi:hypothetical protein